MEAETLAARLEAHRTGNGWQCRCPAHDDHNASLGIAIGKDGRILLKCHAGCTVEAICAALGIGMADLFQQEVVGSDSGAFGWDERVKSEPERKARKRGLIVATYDYTDAAGKLLFQVCRLNPKGFRQRRPNPEKPGSWVWNLNGQARVLYRLADVLRAKREGRVVFVAEGEKDCDALAALGVCATCNSGGAGKWAEGYTDTLTGANVIVLADRDTPGRRHAADILRALRGKAARCMVVELPDRNGVPVKDAADWIAAGGTIAELRQILCEAPPWMPPQEAGAKPEESNNAASGTPHVIPDLLT